MASIKQAAMFGLDARIALTIFASLSVISAASLVRIFEDLKVTRTVRLFDELEKALGAYLLDIGQNIPNHHTYTGFILGERLLEDVGTVGWNGSYLESFEPSSSSTAFGTIVDISTDTYVKYIKLPKDYSAANMWADFPGAVDCSVGCDYWVRIHTESTELDGNMKGDKFSEALDEYYDGGDGYNTGRIRYIIRHGGRYIALKLMPIL